MVTVAFDVFGEAEDWFRRYAVACVLQLAQRKRTSIIAASSLFYSTTSNVAVPQSGAPGGNCLNMASFYWVSCRDNATRHFCTASVASLSGNCADQQTAMLLRMFGRRIG